MDKFLEFLEASPSTTYSYANSRDCAWARYSKQILTTDQLNEIFPDLWWALAANDTYGSAAKELRLVMAKHEKVD